MRNKFAADRVPAPASRSLYERREDSAASGARARPGSAASVPRHAENTRGRRPRHPAIDPDDPPREALDETRLALWPQFWHGAPYRAGERASQWRYGVHPATGVARAIGPFAAGAGAAGLADRPEPPRPLTGSVPASAPGRSRREPAVRLQSSAHGARPGPTRRPERRPDVGPLPECVFRTLRLALRPPQQLPPARHGSLRRIRNDRPAGYARSESLPPPGRSSGPGRSAAQNWLLGLEAWTSPPAEHGP